ncbi:alpha/beta hydrolase [Acaryochloris marina]|uniref:alpha/beta hydrolase n=1 Tax=Acaryochloris marina TaxID=155978 RepID=UPI001BAFF6BE|nr:alpha/beta hydrolase [Acaryochloris marina]QUY44848.1 alpha/beta hydrolase [Acaryochloris marina S15]
MDMMYLICPSKMPMPVIIWIHGGGWRSGTKKDGKKKIIPFALRGYFCVSINYRLSFEAPFPAQLEDCKCAVRFLRANANELNLNPRKIGVWGSSSGGHLAALLGTTQHMKEFDKSGPWRSSSSKVQAVCDWFGPTDFLRMNSYPSEIDHDAYDSPESELIGYPIQSAVDKVALANPITHITSSVPPFLIMHADNDLLVPLNQSQILYESLSQAGNEVTFEVIHGGGHGKKFSSPGILNMVEIFFSNHLEE